MKGSLQLYQDYRFYFLIVAGVSNWKMREVVVGPEASVREALCRIAAGTILSQWAARV